jgi:hypothetical protein
MDYLFLPNCPACKSEAEIFRFMAFTSICCSRVGCTIGTDCKEDFEEVKSDWKEICRIYPKPLPGTEF